MSGDSGGRPRWREIIDMRRVVATELCSSDIKETTQYKYNTLEI